MFSLVFFGNSMKNFLLSTLVASICSTSLGICLDSTSDVLRSSQEGFLERWQDFHGESRNFPLWNAHWNQEELKAHFDQMIKERWAVYFENPEDYGKPGVAGILKKTFQTPEDWKGWGSRFPYAGAFSYNLAHPLYNASLVTLHGKKFLALEAPTKENVSRFFEMLAKWKVTDLVRLVPSTSNNREESFPYWEGHMNINRKNGRTALEASGREINYFFTDRWVDHGGEEPERIIGLVKAVQENKTANQMVAVHCRAGVGRTGTFLAAYTIIRDIDEQISQGVPLDSIQISIDKIMWELSLQRPFMITHFPQYLALHKLAGIYISAKKAETSGK
jgi:hypothetical protein